MNIKQLAGIIRGSIRAQRTQPGIEHVGRGNGLARRPGGVGAQVKSINAAIRADVPPLGQARNRTSGLAIEPGQSFKERFGNAHIRHGGHNRRIQRFRLVTIHDNEIRGRRRATAGQQNGRGYEK